jgi:FkbM family methyltransferase
MDFRYAVRHLFIKYIFKFKDLVNNFFSVKRLDYKKDIFIYINNLREYFTRANSCSKETETIDWIEENSKKHKIMYDIGANIGAYSLVAAKQGMEVYSFEPSYSNFYTLNRNITLNNLDKKISTFQIAFSTNSKVENEFHIKSQVKVRKSILIFKLDDLISSFNLPLPEILKIDVDGAEYDIIKGAQDTLKNKKLKTILIEIDLEESYSNKLIKNIENSGFEIKSKHKRSREVYNFIFIRK